MTNDENIRTSSFVSFSFVSSFCGSCEGTIVSTFMDDSFVFHNIE
jgi:hypothetical protein